MEATNFFCYHLTQSWQISQNKVNDEKLVCIETKEIQTLNWNEITSAKKDKIYFSGTKLDKVW